MEKFERFDFVTLQALAKNNNLKFNFKTKTPLIRHLITNNISPPLKHLDKSKRTDDTDSSDFEESEHHTDSLENFEEEDDADMEWEQSFTPTKVKIHTDNLDPKDLRHMRELLAKLNANNKLTEVERVQKYVFNQLGIL